MTKSGYVAAHSSASMLPMLPPMAILRCFTPRWSRSLRCRRTLSLIVTGVGKSAAYHLPSGLAGPESLARTIVEGYPDSCSTR